LTLLGGMRFDTDDLDALEGLGLMDDIILHEMMHVLGFGIFWETPVDYLEEPSDPSNTNYDENNTDTHFTGPNAIAQFNSIGGTNYTGGAIVPVENDAINFGTGSLDGHWRESVFDEEIMTPAANLSNPLSVVTIGSFEDLGYTVDYGAADTYNQTFSVVLGLQNGPAETPAVDLSGDVWRGPIQAVDPDGTRRRIR
ncbi:MAG: leishmanolysin-related zinc metalloendopeptidase, partial [Gemmatimonadales bacterium]